MSAALAEDESLDRVREELGDLMFSCVNLARFLGADAETLLRQASDKFSSRFHRVEKAATEQKKDLREFSLRQLDALWQKAKET